MASQWVGNRREGANSPRSRIHRQRLYLPLDVWHKLDELVRISGAPSIHKALHDLVEVAHEMLTASAVPSQANS
jgi:hypothetical protein